MGEHEHSSTTCMGVLLKKIKPYTNDVFVWWLRLWASVRQ